VQLSGTAVWNFQASIKWLSRSFLGEHKESNVKSSSGTNKGSSCNLTWKSDLSKFDGTALHCYLTSIHSQCITFHFLVPSRHDTFSSLKTVDFAFFLSFIPAVMFNHFISSPPPSWKHK
jgi:hypothetical protein